MHRIFFPKELKDRIEIRGSKAHKISSVLRMNKEEKLLIFDGKGKSQIMKIDEMNKDSVSLYAPKNIINKPKNTPEVILAISLIKPSRFETAIEKTTELGVSEIYPMVTQNTNNIFHKRMNQKIIDRMTNIAISAAEQCGNDFIPQIHFPLELEQILNFNDEETKFILYYEKAKLDSKIDIKITGYKKVVILIGPEGGFTESEYSQINQKSLVLSLGENILRTETASICAVHEVNRLIRSTL